MSTLTAPSSLKKSLSKSDLLKGKLEELIIPNYPSEGDSSVLYLGPLRTGTALSLFKKTKNTPADIENGEVDFDLITDELSAAISEAVVDETGQRILSPEEVVSLPLEIYPVIANAVMEKVNQSLVKFNRVQVTDDLVETAIERVDEEGDNGEEIPLETTGISDLPTDLQEN